jgi:lipopolysaccharide export LptBFGC system permease protein LptF
VSLHRLALPVFAAGLALSGALFAFDYSLVTRANIIQDALRDKIKGRPAQTYLSPDRKWIHGTGKRIFYYRFFDPDQGILGGVSVYEYETEPMRLSRHVYAESARWEPRLNTWVFQNGWSRDVREGEDRYRNYQGETATFAGITEAPAYFQKEVRTYKQMDYAQLRDYIGELKQSGFNTLPLQVQFHKKFAVPLFVFIMSMLAAPFAFLTGTRGAMTGVGISFGIAIIYFASNSLFEQLGNAGQLPPAMAAWSPNALFTLVGGYLLTRLRT